MPPSKNTRLVSGTIHRTPEYQQKVADETAAAIRSMSPITHAAHEAYHRSTRPRYEYATLSSERPLTTEQLDAFGADGWELVSVYVRMDAVHAVFKREVV